MKLQSENEDIVLSDESKVSSLQEVNSDKYAKYHVPVRDGIHKTPEELSRVLDVMAASVIPESSKNRTDDENGDGEEEERK